LEAVAADRRDRKGASKRRNDGPTKDGREDEDEADTARALSSPAAQDASGVVPNLPNPDFVEHISDDLAEDAAEALKLLRPPSGIELPPGESGIPLQDLGLPVRTKGTTQKIDIRSIVNTDEIDTFEPDTEDGDGSDDDTVTDLPAGGHEEDTDDITEDGS
jgi:hypothetical protein